jgi:3alpha(or 20beta)-hydroxysteroid dehydrogenase
MESFMKALDTLFNLQGKVALVTGAARGIGLACAHRLAEAGAIVLITDIDADIANQAAADLCENGWQVSALQQDVTQEQGWIDTIDHCVNKLRGIDILVNNAGIYIGHLLVENTLEQIQTLNRINIESIFLGMKYASLAMRPEGAAGNGGSIINLSSVAGLTGTPGHSAYGSTKGAVRSYSKHAAVEFARFGYGIRVNSVHPGVIDTAMGDLVFDDFVEIGLSDNLQAATQQVDELIPTGRVGTVEEIANTVLFLASDASSYTTGAELVVDGGLTAA